MFSNQKRQRLAHLVDNYSHEVSNSTEFIGLLCEFTHEDDPSFRLPMPPLHWVNADELMPNPSKPTPQMGESQRVGGL